MASSSFYGEPTSDRYYDHRTMTYHDRARMEYEQQKAQEMEMRRYTEMANRGMLSSNIGPSVLVKDEPKTNPLLLLETEL